MCGIAGIINVDKTPVEIGLVRRMNEVINHRGPDAVGICQYANVLLGHKRLSIIDLSPDGNQPMHFLDKYTIVFNGEIYNYLEIHRELVELGYSFRTKSDTEVILAAYDYWGELCVEKFNGMWAFAILDKVKNSLFFSRDRFGVKPLYYAMFENQFIFGSEIKQILCVTEHRLANTSILMDFLIMGLLEHSEETFFDGIKKVLPSHNMVYDLDDNTIKRYQYFDIKINKDYNSLNLQEAQDIYGKLLKSAIQLRLRSDVKVGTCLSGGLDSSAIAALGSMENKTQSEQPFVAIHAKSTEEQTDESFYAKLVSNAADLDLKIISPDLEELKSNLEEVVYTQEEPFGGLSIFMQYCVMKEAKRNNCIVLLDGQGGDETLLGYERYYPAVLLNQKSPVGMFNFLMGARNSRIGLMTIIGYFIYFTCYPLRMLILKRRAQFINRAMHKYISFDELKINGKNYFNLFKLQVHELYKTQLQALLRYEDRNSMRHSIETRLPFLDYRLVELSLNLKETLKIKNGWTKYILRKSIETLLPREVVWRKNKFGFEAPKSQWNAFMYDELAGCFKQSSILQQIVNKDIDISKLNTVYTWRLLSIAKWEKIYKVKFSDYERE